ncbi:MAG: EpsG family protein [Acutalibacteraceae bacterium]
MLFWIILLGFSLICYAFCSNQSKLAANNGGIIRKRNNINWVIVFVFAAVLIVFCGLRSGIGDTGYYMYRFNEYKFYSLKDFSNLDIPREKGFGILMILIGQITDSEQAFLFVVAAFTIGLIIISIYKYSEDIGMSMFLFYVTGIYLGTMNGLRQYIVVAVLFFATKYIVENKPIRYMVLVLLLSTIHTSALFMLPVFFFARKKVWNASTVLYIAVVLFLVANFSSVLQNSEIFLENTVYDSYIENLKTDTESGANILRVLVMLVPPAISFIYRKRVDQDDIYYRVYSNIMLLNAFIYMFASYNWLFARFAMYTNIYSILFYPYILKRAFRASNQKIIKGVMIALFCLFLVFEIRSTPYISYYLGINKDLIGPLIRTYYSIIN